MSTANSVDPLQKIFVEKTDEKYFCPADDCDKSYTDIRSLQNHVTRRRQAASVTHNFIPSSSQSKYANGDERKAARREQTRLAVRKHRASKTLAAGQAITSNDELRDAPAEAEEAEALIAATLLSDSGVADMQNVRQATSCCDAAAVANNEVGRGDLLVTDTFLPLSPIQPSLQLTSVTGVQAPRVQQLYMLQVFDKFKNVQPIGRPDLLLTDELLATLMIVKAGSQGLVTGRQDTHKRTFRYNRLLDSFKTNCFTFVETCLKDKWKANFELYEATNVATGKRETELLVFRSQSEYAEKVLQIQQAINEAETGRDFVLAQAKLAEAKAEEAKAVAVSLEWHYKLEMLKFGTL